MQNRVDGWIVGDGNCSGMTPPLRWLVQSLASLGAAAVIASCASTEQLQVQATEAGEIQCSGPQVSSYHDLFDSVVEEQALDIRLVRGAIQGDEGFGELSAASRRARDREIALRRADIPPCLARAHLNAVESAEEMSRAVELVLGGEPRRAEPLLRSAEEHLGEARRLLRRASGG